MRLFRREANVSAMRCPVCGAVHEERPLKCPTTGLAIPATLEALLTLRRLGPVEVLRVGLAVCDRWRTYGVSLADVRPRSIVMGYDGDIGFSTARAGGNDSESLGLRTLGGVLHRCLDGSRLDVAPVAAFLEGLSTVSDVSLGRVRVDFQRHLDALTEGDGVSWSDDDVNPPDGMPTVAMNAPDVTPLGPEDRARGGIGPADAPTADPYADTYVRPRSEILPDGRTDPTVTLSSIKVRDDSMPSVRAGVPGPGADPLPSEVRPRPSPPPAQGRSTGQVLLVAGAVAAVAVVAAAVMLGM